MRYLLDTNICVYVIKRSPKKVLDQFRRRAVGEVGISAITYAELEYGVANSSDPQQNQALLNQFIAPLELVEFQPGVAPIYGQIRADLRRTGRLIGPLDMLIAAHAVFMNCTLVTNNKREFSRIPGLQVENWA